MTTTMAVEAVAQSPEIYRNPSFGNTPSGARTSQFTAALERAQTAQLDPLAAGDRYLRAEIMRPIATVGDGAMDQLGPYATLMSRTFRQSIDTAFSKLSHLDFTEPSSMITVLEVHLGVFSAATHVQFASKVADFSVHGLTTLFRNQG